MSKIDDGGTAFPYGQKNFTERYSEGLSMRDYFAAAALTGILANTNSDPQMKRVCEGAYFLADLMIAARKEGA